MIRDFYHIKEIARHLDTIPYEILCTVGKRVPRIYIDDILAMKEKVLS